MFYPWMFWVISSWSRSRFEYVFLDLWIDYVKMELTFVGGKPETVGHLYWRAVKDLDANLVDEFVQNYAVITGDDSGKTIISDPMQDS